MKKLLRTFFVATLLATMPLVSAVSFAPVASYSWLEQQSVVVYSQLAQQQVVRVPLASVATPAQVETLGLLYARAHYLVPVDIENTEYGRNLLNAVVHPGGALNQPRDPWSQSMVRVFGKPARMEQVVTIRTLPDLIAVGVQSINEGRGWPRVSNADFNRVQRWAVEHLGSATGWRQVYVNAMMEAEAAYRARQQ